MKNLQINTSPIGAQEYNLGEKVGEDIYIYDKLAPYPSKLQLRFDGEIVDKVGVLVDESYLPSLGRVITYFKVKYGPSDHIVTLDFTPIDNKMGDFSISAAYLNDEPLDLQTQLNQILFTNPDMVFPEGTSKGKIGINIHMAYGYASENPDSIIQISWAANQVLYFDPLSFIFDNKSMKTTSNQVIIGTQLGSLRAGLISGNNRLNEVKFIPNEDSSYTFYMDVPVRSWFNY